MFRARVGLNKAYQTKAPPPNWTTKLVWNGGLIAVPPQNTSCAAAMLAPSESKDNRQT